MKFSPCAAIFELMVGQPFDDLVKDIEKNGLIEPIWLYNNQILDGRHRYLACQKAKVKPRYRIYNGPDPIGFVISLNKHRRHLTDAQLAFAADRAATMRQGQRTDLAPGGAKSQADAAAEIGTSRRSLQRAKVVREKGSEELKRAAESSEVPLQRAASVVDLPKEQQLAAATQPAPKPIGLPPDLNLDEGWAPDASDDAHLAQLEKELAASTDKVMNASDQMAAAHEEIKRQAAEIATLRLSRDGYMNERLELVRYVKKQQRVIGQQQRVIDGLRQSQSRDASVAGNKSPGLPKSADCPKCDGEGCGYCEHSGEAQPH